jgi:hypothetical protein
MPAPKDSDYTLDLTDPVALQTALRNTEKAYQSLF